MKEKFLDYVGTNGKSYSWANGGYAFRIELKPLNDWEMLSLGGGKNHKVLVDVDQYTFVNACAYTIDRTGKLVDYRYEWISFSKIINNNTPFFAARSSITGCEPRDWWYDEKYVKIFNILNGLLSGTYTWERALNCGGIEEIENVQEGEKLLQMK